MLDNLLNREIVPLFLLGVYAFSFLVQQVFFWLIHFRLIRHRTPESKDTSQGISVVICAHNEHHHLEENLPLVLEQDYPEYEVLVVNHMSDDDTHFLLNSLAGQYPHLNTITIEEDLNFFTGKKFPLSIGIRSARYDRVLLTDADCRPVSKDWIRHMSSAFTKGREIVLGYGAYQREPGFLNRMIRFDTAQIAMQYLSCALAGIPYMGVGRNLAYRKEVFFRNQGFISHYRIRSGDDDLFINRVAGRANTTISVHPDSFTISDPCKSWGAWITQKRRHLSTSHHYRFGHRLLLGLHAFSLFTFYTLLAVMLALGWSPIPVAGLFILRLASQYIIFGGVFRRLNEKDIVPLMPLYEIVLLLFNAGLLISNQVRKPSRWK